jgi:subtilase family serine protease
VQPRALTRLPARRTARRAARAAVLAALALTGSAAAVGAAPVHVGAARHGADLSAPPTPDECLAYTGGRCLTPAGLRSAYDLDGLAAAGTTGAGVTIGIVDSFGSPTIAHDLTVYDRQYDLPAIDLRVITPEGPPPAYDAQNSDRVGWADESTLDVEVAHTIAPFAAIVLIETPTSETEGLAGFPQIIAAENYVISHHLVDVLSQSFAATEATFTSAAQVRQLSAEVYPAAEKAGVTVLSSSGDNGPTDDRVDETTLYTTPQTDWPASDPLVTSVGGTMLDIGADGSRTSPDAAWGGQPGGGAGGGGRSTIFPRPAFQASVAGVVGDHRGVPDISLDAASSSGLITYGSFGGGDGWSVGGGTSQASPLLAGIVALADQKAHGRVGYLDPLLYGTLDHAADGIVDVTRGSNDLVDPGGKPDPVPGYAAAPGYDLATGLGTIDGGLFVPALAAVGVEQHQPLGPAGCPPGGDDRALQQAGARHHRRRAAGAGPRRPRRGRAPGTPELIVVPRPRQLLRSGAGRVVR